MPTVIILIIAVIFIVLIAWLWHSLGDIDKKLKMPVLVAGLIVVWFLTFIIYSISKMQINYESQEVMKTIRGIFVLIFTIINGYILLPYIFKTLDKIDNEEIEKDDVIKRIVIIAIIFIIVAIIETKYLASVQNGTLDMIKK